MSHHHDHENDHHHSHDHDHGHHHGHDHHHGHSHSHAPLSFSEKLVKLLDQPPVESEGQPFVFERQAGGVPALRHGKVGDRLGEGEPPGGGRAKETARESRVPAQSNPAGIPGEIVNSMKSWHFTDCITGIRGRCLFWVSGRSG